MIIGWLSEKRYGRQCYGRIPSKVNFAARPRLGITGACSWRSNYLLVSTHSRFPLSTNGERSSGRIQRSRIKSSKARVKRAM
jgi:hypothetical protein